MMNGLRYTVVEGWEQLPKGYKHRSVPDVAVDSRDRVYLLSRIDPRVIAAARLMDLGRPQRAPCRE